MNDLLTKVILLAFAGFMAGAVAYYRADLVTKRLGQAHVMLEYVNRGGR